MIAVWVPPAIVVVKSAAVISAVMTDQSLVRVANAGVDIGNNQSGAINAHSPDVVGIDVRQVGFNSLDAIVEHSG